MDSRTPWQGSCPLPHASPFPPPAVSVQARASSPQWPRRAHLPAGSVDFTAGPPASPGQDMLLCPLPSSGTRGRSCPHQEPASQLWEPEDVGGFCRTGVPFGMYSDSSEKVAGNRHVLQETCDFGHGNTFFFFLSTMPERKTCRLS